ISQMVKDDMKAAFGYPLEKIHLITNGIDTSRYTALNKNNKKEIRERYGIAPDTFVFLFVANNLALKGFDLLLDACRMLGCDAFKVLVTGPASAEDKAMASDLGDIIVFGDRAKDLERIYPSCDCLVHPTYYDACSLVVLEALSCDLPVITTSANGASMYINPENGCVVPPADAAALAEAMKKQMTDNRAIGGDRVSFKDHNRVFVEIEALLKR
ncbi:MAG: glycosyltransferase family 4 protein, partial [Thermodesulfobacteriota bacterium]|nr:glycosyltransferase family 4 protein [Thermodesulfobacteriota bacterium]